MSNLTPKDALIFATETREQAKVVALQHPETGRVALGIEIGEAATTVSLSAGQAAALGVALLAANLEATAVQAERIPEAAAAELGVALLSAPAAAALLRQHGHGHLLRDPSDGPEAA